MIEIEFYDNDILNTLLPMKTLQPDKVFFFVEKSKRNRPLFMNLRRVLDLWNRNAEIEFIEEEMTNIVRLTDSMNQLIGRLSGNGEKIYLDLSGGNSVLTACAYNVSRAYPDVIPVFIDMTGGVLREAYGLNIVRRFNHLTLEDYLTAIGAAGSETDYPLLDNYDPEEILSIAEAVINNNYELNGLTDSFCMNQSRQHATSPNYWLNLYVYCSIRYLFDEAYLDLAVDWTAWDNVTDHDTVIDIIGIKESIPVLFSCKMARPDSHDLYRIHCLAENFAAQYSFPIVVTNESINEPANINGFITDALIKRRSDKMHVSIISMCDIQSPDELADRVKSIIDM